MKDLAYSIALVLVFLLLGGTAVGLACAILWVGRELVFWVLGVKTKQKWFENRPVRRYEGPYLSPPTSPSFTTEAADEFVLVHKRYVAGYEDDYPQKAERP